MRPTVQFYDYRTTRDVVGWMVPEGKNPDAFYKEKFSFALGGMNDKRTALQMLSEGMWERERRPYYNVYTTIAPMLLKLNLEVDTKFIEPPMPAFCVRLPVERTPLCYTWQGEPWHIRSILVGPGTMQSGGKTYGGPSRTSRPRRIVLRNRRDDCSCMQSPRYPARSPVQGGIRSVLLT